MAGPPSRSSSSPLHPPPLPGKALGAAFSKYLQQASGTAADKFTANKPAKSLSVANSIHLLNNKAHSLVRLLHFTIINPDITFMAPTHLPPPHDLHIPRPFSDQDHSLLHHPRSPQTEQPHPQHLAAKLH
ncbi:hypothetical protein TIFTF001_024314 [Ficus carica]|uniref:Uncharacterized protein n=1 Tax=Ficus carica TaxID=3494 RepID=A0AA88B0M1_FICCA|nr:hypothetical protein TIFTF001_024314 [Ficus carica]